MEVCPYSYFQWCGYFKGPWVSFVAIDEFSVRVKRITRKLKVDVELNVFKQTHY